MNETFSEYQCPHCRGFASDISHAIDDSGVELRCGDCGRVWNIEDESDEEEEAPELPDCDGDPDCEEALADAFAKSVAVSQQESVQ